MRSRSSGVGDRQMLGQRLGFFEREVGELDAVADIEGRARDILDQVAGRRDADEHKGQALQASGSAARRWYRKRIAVKKSSVKSSRSVVSISSTKITSRSLRSASATSRRYRVNRWPNAWSACAAHHGDDGVFSES